RQRYGEVDKTSGLQQLSGAFQGGDGIGDVLHHMPKTYRPKPFSSTLTPLGQHPLPRVQALPIALLHHLPVQIDSGCTNPVTLSCNSQKPPGPAPNVKQPDLIIGQRMRLNILETRPPFPTDIRILKACIDKPRVERLSRFNRWIGKLQATLDACHEPVVPEVGNTQ